ncbi:MAG: hypothetical protein HY752_00270 [Nitrospirae bacterium]|nr:hypothetical protein [Nitrospirota bacterium]
MKLLNMKTLMQKMSFRSQINYAKFDFNLMLILVFLSAVVFFGPSSAFSKPSLNDRLVLMWQVQKDISDEDLKFLKEKGVNLVQSFNILKWTEEEIQNYLDRMGKNGMGVIMSIDKAPILNRTASGWSYNYTKAAEFINRWKNHPSIFAWHICDEPSSANKKIPVSLQEEIYRHIKSLDPAGQVFISWNGTVDEHYNFFSEKAFDMLDIHAYVNDYPGHRQKNLIEIFKRHRTRIYPVLITISVHNRQNRPKLPSDAVRQQYEFFFKQNNLTRSIGFYGWKLSPNTGIKDDSGLIRQFMDLQFKFP